MLEIDPKKRIIYADQGFSITDRQIEVFFTYGFHRTERKYKLLFSILAATGIRVGEACALNLTDFIPGSNFQWFYMKISKKNKANVLRKCYLPLPLAQELKQWILYNYQWIKEKEGFIFPLPNNQHYHINLKQVDAWFSKKRKQLAQAFPTLGFGERIQDIQYAQEVYNHYLKKTIVRMPMYRFRVHSFRHFYCTHVHTNPELVMRLIHHDDLKTTLRYRNQADMASIERKLHDELFNNHLAGPLQHKAKTLASVWRKNKKYLK
jgi:integrase